MLQSNSVTSKGQATIPKHVRDELGIKTGDRVRYEKNQNGRYEIVKEPTLDEVLEMNAQYTENVPNYTDDELKKLIHEGMQKQAVERYRRSLS